MTANAVVRARIDEKTKKKATKVLKSLGLTPSIAFRLMMTRIATDKALPFDLQPNAQTAEAIEELNRGGGKSFASIDDLMADLNAND
ncbi:type II toxin-antitoxin system RelB/DinJ family antitoxin [Granulicella sp. dw_53]|uniref:type II toxin-antitoxin system RelB/DinJ family antitoxin n=1 Tax=Granulicella sp. dw_53 TaxID=2719792 RepID=UPI001BD3937D|nr:type II toxin-antitoxin system RelB/DinJ family antitoxin [Granulicella sp. dw_53]